MAKSRPPGSSKTERKRDPQETTGFKSPPSPTNVRTDPGTGLSAVTAPLAVEETDSPTPQSTPQVTTVSPLPAQDSAPATQSPALEASNSRSPSPTAAGPVTLAPTETGETKPEPKADTETRPIAGAKPLPVVKGSAENGVTAESTGAIERTTLIGGTLAPPVTGPRAAEPRPPRVVPNTSAGVRSLTPVSAASHDAKHDPASAVNPPSVKREGEPLASVHP